MSDYIVALTGGIGSGKSTAAKLFSQFHIPIIDADKIANELVQPKSPFLDKIIVHFGNSLLKTDGTLNRKVLRHIVFENAQEKLWLEELLHPAIWERLFQRAKIVQSPYCILVIPLLAETLSKQNDIAQAIRKKINRILVIDAPTSLQRQRSQERDQATREEIDPIIHAQALRSQRLNLADDVITNTGDMTYLRNQVMKLHKKYLSFASRP